MDKESRQFNFDPIRPFYDSEVPKAIERLLSEPSFNKAIKFIFPEISTGEIHALLRQISSVDDFQEKIISGAVNKIIQSTTQGVTVEGLDKLDQKKSFLFISNHRDIVLDSAFLNYELFIHHFPTTRIAIGSNLLQRPWIEDLVKLNKNFIVHRNVHSRLAYEYSCRLSAYIKQSILEENTSVWIAQKEGRSKTGDDKTQAGLVKMFGMTSEGSDIYNSLKITPVSISYEVEPCGGLKAREMYIRKTTGSYIKSEGEDLQSMQVGISGNKGKVHFQFGSVLENSAVEACFKDASKNESMNNLAALIDKTIISNYKLFPNNYIAYYLLTGDDKFNYAFSQEEINVFTEIMDFELVGFEFDMEDLKPYFLNIYANPVINKMNLGII